MSIDKSPEKIQTMFNLISEKYDFINNIISFGSHKIIKKLCIKNLDIKPHDNVIDLCCGTGDLSFFIKKQQPYATVTGIDFSSKMLDIAKDKIPDVKFIQGDVTNLPFDNSNFDFAVIGFGLRNINTPEKAIEEIYRVLKLNGKFLHLDFGEKNLLNKFFDKIVLSFINLFTENTFAYKYLIESKKAFLTPEDLIKDFESKGFKLYRRKDYVFKTISCIIMQK